MRTDNYLLQILLLICVPCYSNITIVTTIHQIPKDTYKPSIHLTEVLLALGENCRSPRVSSVHVLIDIDSDKESVVDRLKQAIISTQLVSLVDISLIRGYNISDIDIP